MGKNNLLMIPPWILIRVKYALNNISMSYPDVCNCMYRT